MSLLSWYFLQYESGLTSLNVHSLLHRIHTKVYCYRIGHLLDLPDELLLMICRYLHPIDVLRAFFSNNSSDRLQCLILKYRRDLALTTLSYSDFCFVIDQLLPVLGVTQLRLSDNYIPCLIDHFVSLSHQIPLSNLRTLYLDMCTVIDSSLVDRLSNLSQLDYLHIFNRNFDESQMPTMDFVALHDFLFSNEISTSLRNLFFWGGTGLVLHNHLKPCLASKILRAEIELETLDDLRLLLNNEIMPCLCQLTVKLTQERQSSSRQQVFSFVHHHLIRFQFIDWNSGLTLTDFACLLRGMIKLQHLCVAIRKTIDLRFAQCSLVENVLPNTIGNLEYLANFSISLPPDIAITMNSNNCARFPMKTMQNIVYTVPCSWWLLPLYVPATDYQPAYQRTIKTILLYPWNMTDEEVTTRLKSWVNVTEVISKIKLPSLQLLRHLQTLETTDGSVVYAPMPLSLRSLTLTDPQPLAVNVSLSTVVHGQVHQLTMDRPLRDEQDLLNVLHQFPNLRFLSITLPLLNSNECLVRIFENDNDRLPHLVCLQARDGESNLWKDAPLKWLTTYTHLKYRSIPFHVNYCEQQGLIVWL